MTNKREHNKKKPSVKPIPTILSFALVWFLTLGNTASPQNNPAMAPPRWPYVSVLYTSFFDPPIIRFKKIIRITMNINMHRACSNSGLPLNACQFTKSMARAPVKIPMIEVEAPTDFDVATAELNRFPPIPLTKYTPTMCLNPIMPSSRLPNMS